MQIWVVTRGSGPSLVQTGEDGLDGLIRGEGACVDGEAGDACVEGVTTVEAELGGGGVFKDRASNVLEHAAVEQGGERGVEKDGEGAGGLLEKEAVREVFRGSAAEGEDGVGAGQGGDESGGLETAEAGFAVVTEELGDGLSGAVLEVGIEVEEVPGEAGGEEAADGGFAGAHEAGEDQTFKMNGDDGSRDLGWFGEGGGWCGRHGFSVV
jgi:hypothetical protein